MLLNAKIPSILAQANSEVMDTVAIEMTAETNDLAWCTSCHCKTLKETNRWHPYS